MTMMIETRRGHQWINVRETLSPNKEWRVLCHTMPQLLRVLGPEFIIFCDGADDWRAQAEIVAKQRRATLFVGVQNKKEFIEKLAEKYHMICKHRGIDKLLFWAR